MHMGLAWCSHEKGFIEAPPTFFLPSDQWTWTLSLSNILGVTQMLGRGTLLSKQTRLTGNDTPHLVQSLIVSQQFKRTRDLRFWLTSSKTLFLLHSFGLRVCLPLFLLACWLCSCPGVHLKSRACVLSPCSSSSPLLLSSKCFSLCSAEQGSSTHAKFTIDWPLPRNGWTQRLLSLLRGPTLLQCLIEPKTVFCLFLNILLNFIF